MKRTSIQTFAMLALSLVLLLGASLAAGCSDGDDENSTPKNEFKITGVSLPSTLEVASGGEMTIAGKGFAAGDQIRLQSTSNAKETYTVDAQSVTATAIVFRIPSAMGGGQYRILVVRGSKTLTLGIVTFTVVQSMDIPDVAGKNIKGCVLCEGEPVAGVVVSDGFILTRTDDRGVYYLDSDKRSGYVFISVPSGYEVPVQKTIPQFFKRLSLSASKVEQKDFALTRRDNGRHRTVVFTDVHLANRNDDRQQFSNGFMQEMKQQIAAADNEGTGLYCLALGDLAWDGYWYERKYDLSNYLSDISSLDCPIFSTTGNHDNDPYVANDWMSEVPFRRILGPTYFSFNAGKVHYILLDDVQYVNTGGSQGTVGKRNYNAVVVNDQLEWLKADLATITDKHTPIVVGMHIPLYNRPTLTSDGEQTQTYRLANAAALMACFEEFTDVHFVSGHTHMNYNVNKEANLREHNIAAVCATWWWTGRSGYAGNHICVDGSPGGYKVFEMNGTDAEWYYKGIGKNKDYQFRAYDLNETLITVEKYCPATSVPGTAAKSTGGYEVPNKNNEVLINVWDWDSDWTLRVKELSTNKELDVTRVYAYDPLHIISYNMMRFSYASTTSLTFPTEKTAHMFKVTASSADSSLEITATNGRCATYTQTMTRPKPLEYQMQ